MDWLQIWAFIQLIPAMAGLLLFVLFVSMWIIAYLYTKVIKLFK